MVTARNYSTSHEPGLHFTSSWFGSMQIWSIFWEDWVRGGDGPQMSHQSTTGIKTSKLLVVLNQYRFGVSWKYGVDVVDHFLLHTQKDSTICLCPSLSLCSTYFELQHDSTWSRAFTSPNQLCEELERRVLALESNCHVLLHWIGSRTPAQMWKSFKQKRELLSSSWPFPFNRPQ